MDPSPADMLTNVPRKTTNAQTALQLQQMSWPNTSLTSPRTKIKIADVKVADVTNRMTEAMTVQVERQALPRDKSYVTSVASLATSLMTATKIFPSLNGL